MKLNKLWALNLLILPLFLNQSGASAEENKDLASVVLEPLIYKSADSTLIENIVTKQLRILYIQLDTEFQSGI